MSYLKQRIQAFKVAFAGLFAGLRHETHMRLHAAAAIMVILLALNFSVTRLEWFVILICIALVISLELVNSALERLCDLVHPQQHPAVKHIKDLAAAAVLVAALASAVIGLLIFVPHFLS
jgi:diacylglycerol kinase (ATP)